MKCISIFIFVVLVVTTVVVNTQTTVDTCTYIDKYGYYYDLRALAGQDFNAEIKSIFSSDWTQLFSVCSINTECQSKYSYPAASGCSYWGANKQLDGLTAEANTQRFGPGVVPGTGVNLISDSTSSTLIVNMVCSVDKKNSTCIEAPKKTYTCTIYSKEACPFYQANIIPATSTIQVSCQGASGYGPTTIPYTDYQCSVLNTSPLQSQYVMLYAVVSGDTKLVDINGDYLPLYSNGTGLWYPSQAVSPLVPSSKVSFSYTIENNQPSPRFLPVVLSD
ncbi:hypothetical protein DFA_09211 [Cavenderia fasciculata]|uniref:MRH domain-containing protein n=1 Tax=Cavenderia fasciculata TaxID=261658 RepID=F4Q701_CACFS|nr:uncharacterized protein DFA_09211 [Cavenderia fasciculata]EGG16183.1 hypothetical protein DFA_09211 [Cavenderia fasciculata]|eukprot:XP_004354567.1 hypothetical protein DFA_09211 [Cavenderia fasciculata]